MTPSTVPTIHFDTAALPEGERFERWRAAVAAYDVAQPAGAGPFEARVDAWMLGELVVTSNRLGAVRFVRSAEKAKADGAEHYTFVLLKQGSWAGDVEGRAMTAGPGQVVSFDLTRPMDVEASGGESITIGVPRTALMAAAPHLPDLHGAALGGPMGRLLSDHFLSLVRELPAMAQTEAPAAVRATVGLIASCLAAAADTQGAREPAGGQAIQHRVRRHIDERLASAELSPDSICRDLGLSRSTLYRAFADSPGIAAYIRTRRLEAVHVLLGDPGEQRSIADIAYGFGFVSDAHFSRVFRERFGYSPREARRGGSRLEALVAESDMASGPALFRKWIDRLQ